MITPARWAIFVHDPDGDSGYGAIVGPFRTVAAADRKAEAIRKAAEDAGLYVEPIIVNVYGGSTGARRVAEMVTA